MSAVHVSTESRQDYVTPMDLVDQIAQRFGAAFVLDLAASIENTRCDSFYHLGDNSLDRDWVEGIRECGIMDGAGDKAAAYLNPPFRGVDPWMEKCKVESRRGARIISLTLASLGTGWYRHHVEGEAMSLILRERVVFEGQKDPFPKDLMVTLWGFGLTGLGFWSRK